MLPDLPKLKMLLSVLTKAAVGSEVVFRFAGHHLFMWCRRWWVVSGGGVTGQCPAINSQPVGAKFGSEVIRFPHRVHMILPQLLE